MSLEQLYEYYWLFESAPEESPAICQQNLWLRRFYARGIAAKLELAGGAGS